jgi:uncharacterized repeat protein (TIGR03803 family)
MSGYHSAYPRYGTLAVLLLGMFLPTGFCEAGANYRVVYAFNDRGGSDGAQPYASLIADKAGNLYGTTTIGGAHGQGTVFEIAPGGGETVLYSFNDNSENDGADPYGALVRDKAGNLYGTTNLGGAGGTGTVFKLAPDGTETVLHSFVDNAGSDGARPYAGLIRGKSGTFYGTTTVGGANGQGTVFEITTNGTETIIYSFNDNEENDGADPYGSLIMDKAGNLYGTTSVGGAHGQGTVFKIAPAGAETVLYSFNDNDANDGADPYAGLITDKSGNLYGTTTVGGAHGQGTVFRIAADGTEAVLYSFNDNAQNDGADPYSTLLPDEAGNLYGTTSVGGANGSGTIFKLSPGGTETLLHSFQGQTDGATPYSGLIENRKADGRKYLLGTASCCGSGGDGVVFEIKK